MVVGMDTTLGNLRISAKLLLLILIPLGAIAIIAGVAIHSLVAYDRVLVATGEVAVRRAAVERINALVYSVVSESRGIYMSTRPEAIVKFADGLEAQLRGIEANMESFRGSFEDSGRLAEVAVGKRLVEFVTLRRKLVEAAVRSGADAARAIGDNEVNRSTRKVLNEALVTLSRTVGSEADVLQSDGNALKWKSIVALVATATITLVLTIIMASITAWRAIARPLNSFQQAIFAIAQGKLDIDIPQINRKDEIGDLARSLLKLRDHALEARRLEGIEIEAQSLGKARTAKLEKLVNQFDLSIQSHLSEMAVALERRGQSTLAATDATLGNVRAVGQSATLLATSIQDMSLAADKSRMQSDQTVAAAEGAVADVAKLQEAADKAGGVVALIRSIAENTNLLALNATIEAARAGEAGKGFAVVAGEVKTLAEQTRKATDDVAGELERIRVASHASADAIRALFDAVGQIGNAAGGVAVTVDKQLAATRAIAESIERVTAETQEVSSTVRGSNDALAIRTKHVQDAIQQFLNEVRAA